MIGSLVVAVLASLPYCPGWQVRGMEYDVCVHGPRPGLYAFTVDPPAIGYRLDLVTWIRSQVDTTMGDDERLGA